MSERLDMSAFEAQFNDGDRYSDRMSNDDFERLGFLNDRIFDIDEVTDFRKLSNEELSVKAAEINAVLARIRAMEKKWIMKRKPLDEAMAQNDQGIRVDRRTREALERERRRLLEEIAARERLLAQRDLLFSSTANKPWAVGVNGKKALPHQLEGAHRLVSAKRALLGDKPGLGKTLQAIMTIDMLRAEGNGQKVLIFTPKSVLADFERAFSVWTDPTFVHVLNQTIKGIKTELLAVIEHMPEAIVITNYEVWRKDRSILDKLIDCKFDTVILDEAHVLKGWTSKTTQDIKGLIYAENHCPKCGSNKFANRGTFHRLCAMCDYVQEKTGEFCSVKNVYPMTGTPMLNKPQELFPQLYFMDRESFPNEKSFLTDYCHKEFDYSKDSYYWSFGAGGSERLLKKLGMRYTARTRESAGVVMPPQEIKHHYLELDPEKYPKQAKFVKELRERARLVFTDDAQLTQDAILAWYMRMQQAASWPDGIKVKGCKHDPECWDDEQQKIVCFAPSIVFPPEGTPQIGESVMMDEAESIVFEAVEDGDRIVVYSRFRTVLAELERRCEVAGLRHAKIVGGIPDSKRQEYIDDFNINRTKIGEHKYDVLLCQYQTADTGLNLSGAHQLLCIERQWNPGKEEQTIDRVRRLDSTHETIVHILHCAGTATDLIDAIIDQKAAWLEGFDADVNLQEAMRKFLEG